MVKNITPLLVTCLVLFSGNGHADPWEERKTLADFIPNPVPDLDELVVEFVDRHLASDPETRKNHGNILAELSALGNTLGPRQVRFVSEQWDRMYDEFNPSVRRKQNHYRVQSDWIQRTYEFTWPVVSASGSVQPEQLVAEAEIIALIPRLESGAPPDPDATEVWQRFHGIELVKPYGKPVAFSELDYRHLDGFVSGRRKPFVIAIKDKVAFANMNPSGRVGKIDFETQQGVLISWGEKPTTDYDVSVVSVRGDARKTVIVVKTSQPKGDVGMAFTYPATGIVIPRTERLEVIVTGERIANYVRTEDLTFSEREGLKVIVK